MATKICGRCGQTIPEWANGVCYTCERNERDQKRYGRRRVQRPSSDPIRPARKPPAEQGVCEICGKTVRKDRLLGHKFHAHGQRPFTESRTKGHRSSSPATNKPRRARTEPPPFEPVSQPATTISTPDRDTQRIGVNRFLADLYEKEWFLSNILQGRKL